MRIFLRAGLAVVLSIFFCIRLSASDSLKVGDPAPKLQTGRFIQGEPVTNFEFGKAYLIEFWATWCAPCVAAIPHINETYAKFKDRSLVVIGQDCSEQDDQKVVRFVKSRGNKMTYPVALDDTSGSKTGKMVETWLNAAANQHGIPMAFLIDKRGRIAWIGPPMRLREQILDDVLSGKFGLDAARAEDARQKADDEKQNTLMAAIIPKFDSAVRDRDWSKALAEVVEMAKAAPDDFSEPAPVILFNILIPKNEEAAAFKILRQYAEAHANDSSIQNDLAWMIVSRKSIKHPDLDLAQTLAQRAVDGAKEPEQKSQFLNTLARVKFMKGRHAEAISIERTAAGLASGDEKRIFQQNVDSYEKAVLPEVP